jgi:hypothetical protein
VSDGPGVVGVRTFEVSLRTTHELGSYGSPRWRLTSADVAPDEGWELQTLPDGSLVAADDPVPEEFEWAYLRWAEGTRAESGIAVLLALPPGRYLLVQSALKPRRTDRVLLGNGYEDSPPNAAQLLHGQQFYAVIVGAHPDRPPATNRPLVGFVVVNYTGQSRPSGALFFDCVDSSSYDSTPDEAADDLMLVVPVTGELVVDAMARFSAAASAQDLERWRQTGARQLADALTGV